MEKRTRGSNAVEPDPRLRRHDMDVHVRAVDGEGRVVRRFLDALAEPNEPVVGAGSADSQPGAASGG